MTYIQMTRNASYNFKAPNIAADSDKKIEVVFPTTEAQDVDPAADPSLTIERTSTVVDLGELAAAATLTVEAGDDVPVGALLLIKSSCGATPHNLTLSTGFTGQNIRGEKNASKSKLFVFDGESFVEAATPVEIEGDVQAVTSGTTMAVTITKQVTILNISTMSAGGTLNLTVDAAVKKGAILHLTAGSDGTARDLTPGTKMTGPVVAGVISKTKAASYIYDGTNFVMMGASIQLN